VGAWLTFPCPEITPKRDRQREKERERRKEREREGERERTGINGGPNPGKGDSLARQV
jgi:hypothetical protein